MTSHQARRLIPHFILDRYVEGERRGRFQAVTMFVDISGFTRLTEGLMQHDKDGAEVLTEVLNGIFGPIVHEVYARGGMISTFAGDAFTAIFPLQSPETYIQAAQSALFIQEFFATHGRVSTRYGDYDMAVKVGLGDGETQWGILGPERMHTYFFGGEAVDACAHAEHHAEPGDIILIPSLQSHLEGIAQLDNHGDHCHLLALTAAPAASYPMPAAPDPAVMRVFLNDSVVDFAAEAEFRNVCSVFISFEEPDKEDDLDHLVSSVMQLSKRYGGYFNKLDFGDKGGVMLALFGAPISHENDLQRAADMLLALTKVDTDCNWRVGLTFGPVYAGIVGSEVRCEYTGIGDIVNLSARLMMQANWRETWCSRQVTEMLGEAYEFEDMGVFKLKGKQGEIPAFKLLHKHESPAGSLYSGRLIGRETELAALRQFVQPLFQHDASKADSFAGVMYVYGEAGMGKSRLIYDFRQELAEQHLLRWAYCPAEGILQQSLNPFTYFLRSYFRQETNLSPTDNRTRFLEALDQLSDAIPAERVEGEEILRELQRTRSMLGAMVDLFWPGSLYESLEPKLRFENTLLAFTALIKAESLVQPVVIEIDDGSAIDADTHTMLQTLTRDLHGYRAAIIFSSRYNDDGSKFQLDLSATTPTSEIELQYLGEESLKKFIEQVLETAVSGETAHFLAEQSNGNPFFAEQLALDLRERGLLVEDAGMLVLGDVKSTDVPTGINALLIARLDRLTNEIKQTVQTASVLGREFMLQVLWHMLAGDPDFARKVDVVENEDIWSALSEIRYLFKHALMRDTAYEMQLRARLRELHRLAAEAIEALYWDELASHYADLAYHYEKAEVIPKAREYLRLAADHAQENYQNKIALSLYERLLNYVEPDELERVDIHEQRANIFANTSMHDQALAEYKTALAELLQQNDANQNAVWAPKLYRKAAWAYMNKGEYGVALQWLERAEGAAGAENAFEMARIDTSVAAILYRQGETTAALQRCQHGLQIAEAAHDSKEVAHAYMLRGTINTGLGELDEAIVDYTTSLEVSRELEDLRQQSEAANSLGAVYHYKASWEQAITNYAEALTIAEEIGYVDQQATVSNNMGEIYVIRGEFDEAEKRFETCLNTWRRTGFQLGVAISHRNLAQIAIFREEWDKALEHIQDGLNTLEQLGARNMMTADIYLLAAEARLGQGRWQDAWDNYKAAYDLAKSQDLKLVEGNSLRMLGRLHCENSEWQEAETALQASRRMADELGMRLELGQTLLDLGKLYRQRYQSSQLEDDRATAVEYTQQAIALFEGMDAQWDLQRARGVLADLSQ
ncbi:MAG: tetratricopeptide repeat protein [Caldilineales bacterium]|nr:tetratricopeptide repeat protein [Caldilineales bacterium]